MTGAVHCRRRQRRSLHPWVFSNEIISVEGEPMPGDTVRVYERRELIGSGMYNPHSLIAVRRYSREEQELDFDFITKRLVAALDYRRRFLLGEDDFRLCYGESDGLPGLVVDKHGPHYVVQTLALAMERRLELVVRALAENLNAASVFEKNDFRLRDLEGLVRREGALHGVPDARVTIREAGARFEVDIAGGQKTGWYYDQRRTRQWVREFARGRRFLDVFSYSGGFAVSAALGGAEVVVAVDSSAAAIALGADNAALNSVADRCGFKVEDAFRFLTDRARDADRFDMVCLDPPAFIKSKRERQGGLRGYRNVNAQAMRILPPGGILVTCSCSHYLGWQDFLDVLAGAARDADREFKVLERVGQGPDHPVLLSMPESEYLRCLILSVA